jgi:hypothetical protein
MASDSKDAVAAVYAAFEKLQEAGDNASSEVCNTLVCLCVRFSFFF